MGQVEGGTGHQEHLPLPFTSCMNLMSPRLGFLACEMGPVMILPAQESTKIENA